MNMDRTTTTAVNVGRAEACANIALAKYWGKADRGDNLTAVPSLSLTLDALRTRTEVTFDARLARDEVIVGGVPQTGRPVERVSEQLDRFRHSSGEARRARVVSANNFPTAAGLASSASAFAALSLATSEALGLSLDAARLSSEARKSSASAARSLFAGFVELRAEADCATPLHPTSHWDVLMLVAVISAGQKAVASTLGMVHTKQTSPYYPAWEAGAASVFERVKAGVAARDFRATAEAMEHSTRMMHATMLTSEPPVLYLKGPTVDLMHEIAALREEGADVAYTMDAGPNVKVLTTRRSLDAALEVLRGQAGVCRVITCRPGPGASPLSLEGTLESATRRDELDLGPFVPGGSEA